MTTSGIRQKLFDYLQVADDKKVEAIYSILSEEVEVEANSINWGNKSFIDELDSRSADYKNGNIVAQSWEQATAQILGNTQKGKG
jgi:hypothetical protein